MSVLCLVPARSGSLGVPRKNIRLFDGHPLLAWSVIAAKATKGIDRTIITTDCPEMAAAGKKYGAEAPFLRPAEIAKDRSIDVEYMLHALDWLQKEDGWIPDYIVQLRPTTPLRKTEVISAALEAFIGDPTASSLRSAHLLVDPPQKLFQIVNGRFQGFFPDDPRPDYFNLPRQTFPKTYKPNGYVDVIRVETLKRTGRLYGSEIFAWVTPTAFQVDSEEDLVFLEWILKRDGNPLRAFLP